LFDSAAKIQKNLQMVAICRKKDEKNAKTALHTVTLGIDKMDPA
jgi:hypothetical protein